MGFICHKVMDPYTLSKRQKKSYLFFNVLVCTPFNINLSSSKEIFVTFSSKLIIPDCIADALKLFQNPSRNWRLPNGGKYWEVTKSISSALKLVGFILTYRESDAIRHLPSKEHLSVTTPIKGPELMLNEHLDFLHHLWFWKNPKWILD